MAVNIKITTTSGRQIDYSKAEDLSIKMNRVADDLQDIEARYGEFSYSFSLPMTRNNVEIFGFAGVQNVRNIFRINPISVEVFNNDLLLLSGQLELQEIVDGKYKCIFFSKLTQLVDALKDKNMQDITTCPKIPWSYEDTIRNHTNSGFTDCDSTPYQFPMVYYNTYFCPTSVFTGLTDTIVDVGGTTNHLFQRERSYQNWYYYINHSDIGENEAYFHQFPLSFYLKPMMEYMLSSIGWSMGGSFWEDSNVKKIIVPYVGDTDVYDRAVYCTSGIPSGAGCTLGGTLMLDTSKFMPDYDCISFLEDIVKLFNLYLMIDVQNQTIVFESYDVMFGSKVSPYNITDKIIGDMSVSRVEDYNPSLHYADVDNQRILGDNRYFGSDSTNAYTSTYLVTKNTTVFNQVYNYIGTTNGEIKVGFGTPTVKRMRIRNDYDIDDVDNSAGDTVFFLPFISKQLPEDNNNKNFSKKDSDTTVYNTEETIQYAGKPTLYYYYGVSTSDFVQHVGKGAQSDYFYYNFDDVNQRIAFCSPFALTAYRTNIDSTLHNAGLNITGSTGDASVMLASYMQSIWLMMASASGVSNTTDFSLILANNNDYADTIYTRFHANKYKRYQQSEVLTATMMMYDIDWRAMQINTPILYDKQIYSILEINNYDIVKNVAEIKLIKQL